MWVGGAWACENENPPTRLWWEEVECKRGECRGVSAGRQPETHPNTLVCLRPRADSRRERAFRRAMFLGKWFVELWGGRFDFFFEKCLKILGFDLIMSEKTHLQKSIANWSKKCAEMLQNHA